MEKYINSRINLLTNTVKKAEESGLVMPTNEVIFDRGVNSRTVLRYIYGNSYLRSIMVEEIDSVTRDESIRAAKQAPLSMDILIVGTCPSGVSVGCEIRKRWPNASIWMAGNRPYRGGQFADEGLDYLLNSPNFGDKLGFPGELDGPNNLGEAAVLQITDILVNEYPLRSHVADVLKTNSFLVAPAITNLDITSYVATKNSDQRYNVVGYHKELGQVMRLNPRVLVFAVGQGAPKYGIDTTKPDTAKAMKTREDYIFNSESFRAKLSSLNPQEVLAMVENNIAFIGGRDSANIAIEGIIAKLSEILSIEKIKQFSINVYGTKYGNAQEFKDKIGTRRYDDLIPFIGNLVQPHQNKATGIFETEDKKVSIEFEEGQVSQKSFGVIVFTTGYESLDIGKMAKATTAEQPMREVVGDGDLKGAIIAKQIGNEAIYVVGTAVDEKYEGKPPRFARSIRKHTPRVTAMVSQLQIEL